MEKCEIKKILDKICSRVDANAKRFDGRIPGDSTDADGKYLLNVGGGWTDSFFVGMLNLAFAYTEDDEYMTYCKGYSSYFSKRAENDEQWCEENGIIPLDHDTGFLFMLSEVYRYKLTGDESAKDTALLAADKLAKRFNDKGGFIRAWDTWKWDTDEEFINDKKGKIIADSMMNLSLLFWAWKETGNERFYNIAVTHANTVMKYIVRPDGSSFHQYNFNPETGEPKRGCTGQGYADDSCWSRGQAWLIYGFTQCYRYTDDERYLDTAVKTAKFFIDNICVNGLVPWDFSCKDFGVRPYDSSACAIALSGMISLNSICPSKSVEDAIYKLYKGIMTQCSALDIDGWESVLLHACGGPAYSAGKENIIINPRIDCPMMYGDYYFFEALLKLYDDKYIDFIY